MCPYYTNTHARLRLDAQAVAQIHNSLYINLIYRLWNVEEDFFWKRILIFK